MELQIRGGADDATAAAITTVVHQTLAEEAEAAKRPAGRPRPSAWTWHARIEAHWRGPGSPDAPLPNRMV